MSVAMRSIEDRVAIAQGVEMPRLGVGTYKAAEGTEAQAEVAAALRIGYRGIDTAAMYDNEKDVGRAVRESGLSRREFFVATKVWNTEQGYHATLAAFEDSLAALALDYVDLYLVHWPIPRLMKDTWRAMEEVHMSRRALSIGVCNFLPHHLEQLLSFAEVPPAVDQVELHPRLQQPDLRRYCARHAITMQAWAPVMRGRVFDIPELVAIGRRHGKTAAQVAIRWVLQLGVTAIPKSVHEERLRENADIFDFELADDEMRAIAGLDTGARIGPDPDRFGV